MTRFCRVAIDSAVQALDRPFDYEIPERLLGRVDVGSVVRVILHGRNMRGFVIELIDEPAVPNPRPVRSLVSPEPLFGPDEIELAKWIARRYVVPLGLVLHDAVPGRFSTPDSGVQRAPGEGRLDRPEWLTTQGKGVGFDFESFLGSASETCFFPPTLREEPELVAWLASEVSSRKGQTLIVCPRVEIADEIAALIPVSVTLHGSERPADRASGWSSLSSGSADVAVIGRAGLLVPMPRLALVIVASAHDHSLKSERAPRLHGLVVARERARRAGVSFVASSPAPPLEVTAGAGVRWIWSKRRANRPETARPRKGPVTPRLLEVVSWAIARGEDALVFTGRRGDSLRLRCADCGWSPACPACGRGMLPPTGGSMRLRCRVCDSEASVPDTCPSCNGALSGRGWGHERIAREIEKAGIAAPVVKVVRGDAPAAGDRPHPAVIIGTLAAANTTRNAGCVCVADLDQLLARPDFRASEYAIQVLHELARCLAPGGRFLIQTREPEHHAVQAFVRSSYRYFFDREVPFREETRYPPFGSIVRVEIDPAHLADLRDTTSQADGELIGALPRGRKVSALIRCRDVDDMVGPLRAFAGKHSGARIDVDPVDVI